MEEIERETINTMDSNYKELASLLSVIMHTNLKYREAVNFVRSGDLVKAFKHIKAIIVAYHYLRSKGE